MTEENLNTEEQPTDDSATAVAESEQAEESTEPFDDHFERVDIEQFSDDDTAAGTAIGKMLALFFLYTVIVMSLSAWWTFSQAD